MLIYQQTPNRINIVYATNAATWVVLSSDGNGYATLAALIAASKTPWPGLDAGMQLQWWMAHTDNGSGADGSAFFFAINRATAPSDATADDEVSGATQINEPGPIWNMWVRKTNGPDRLFLQGGY